MLKINITKLILTKHKSGYYNKTFILRAAPVEHSLRNYCNKCFTQ